MESTNASDIRERSFRFACRVVLLHQWMSRQKNAAKILSSQLLRAGTSLGANLEEAAAGQSKADFIAKTRIALKEARESHYWLRIFESTKIAPPERIASLVSEANELVAILTTIVRKASSSATRGT